MPKKHDVHVTVTGTDEIKFSGGGTSKNNGDVEAELGNNSIIIEGANNFVFTEPGIEFDDPGPFVWAVHDHQIVVIDRNQNNSGNKKVYKYRVSVEVERKGEKITITSPDPLISN